MAAGVDWDGVLYRWCELRMSIAQTRLRGEPACSVRLFGGVDADE